MRIHAAHLSGKPDGPVALLVPTTKQYPEHLRSGMVALDTVPGYDPRVSAPHPDWVAASQPCPTCAVVNKGVQAEPGRVHGWNQFGHFSKDCPDCIGGKPKVELTYPCPTCHGNPVHTYEIDGEQRCPDCIGGLPRVELTYSVDRSHGGGVSHETVQEVSAGVGTIQHVQVVDSHDERIINADSIVVVWAKTGQVILFRGGSNLPITLPPDVKPGDTVAIWTAAAEQGTP